MFDWTWEGFSLFQWKLSGRHLPYNFYRTLLEIFQNLSICWHQIFLRKKHLQKSTFETLIRKLTGKIWHFGKDNGSSDELLKKSFVSFSLASYCYPVNIHHIS